MHRTTRLAQLAALAVSATAMGQVAVLHDGTVVTQKVPIQLFATEGPVWDINIERRTIRATGREITIPASLNGAAFHIEGTELIDALGQSIGSISAANFNMLGDAHAAGAGRIFDPACGFCGPLRLGAIRSLFSTSEARTAELMDEGDVLDRLPVVQRSIEDNYFNIARSIFTLHQEVLPVSWLGRVGIRNADGSYPTNPNALPQRRYWKYPYTSGGTLKSSGTVYADAAGNEYLIPDGERVLELSENVCIGSVRSVALGDIFTPDSFIVGDTAIVMNQDPRFSAKIIGVAGAEIGREYFFSNLTPGLEIAVVGFMVGEHMQMAQEIEVAMYDPALGITFSADRFRVQVSDGEIQFQGEIIPMTGLTLEATIGPHTIPITATPDKVVPGLGLYRLRESGLKLEGVTSVKLTAYNADGSVAHSVEHEIPAEAIAP